MTYKNLSVSALAIMLSVSALAKAEANQKETATIKSVDTKVTTSSVTSSETNKEDSSTTTTQAGKAQGRIAAAVSSIKASVSNAGSSVVNTAKRVTGSVRNGVVSAKDSVVNRSVNAYTGSKDRAVALYAYAKAHPIKTSLIAGGVVTAAATVVALVKMAQAQKTDQEATRFATINTQASFEQLSQILAAFTAMMNEVDATRSIPCAARSIDTASMTLELQQLFVEFATGYEKGISKDEVFANMDLVFIAVLTEMGIDPEVFNQQLLAAQAQIEAQQ